MARRVRSAGGYDLQEHRGTHFGTFLLKDRPKFPRPALLPGSRSASLGWERILASTISIWQSPINYHRVVKPKCNQARWGENSGVHPGQGCARPTATCENSFFDPNCALGAP